MPETLTITKPELFHAIMGHYLVPFQTEGLDPEEIITLETERVWAGLVKLFPIGAQ